MEDLSVEIKGERPGGSSPVGVPSGRAGATAFQEAQTANATER